MPAVTLPEYLEFLGFPKGNNPFASINARDERDVLEGYFVPPPYYATVWGNPSKPASCIILGPTGGGKTALAITIDERARSLQSLEDGRLPVLPIFYDDFSGLGIKQNQHDIETHFRALNFLLVVHILKTLSSESMPHLRLSSSERRILQHCYAHYVGGRAPSEVFEAIQKIRTPWEQTRDVGKRVVEALPLIKLIAGVLELANEKLETASAIAKTIIEIKTHTQDLAANPEVDFHRLMQLASSFYEAVYILVDRVDETTWTQRDPKATYDLIHPLVSNLALLDYPDRTFGFKFFLWDRINQYYSEKARPDRIFTNTLEWSHQQLIEMVQKRIQAFSQGKLTRLGDLFSEELPLPDGMSVEEIVAVFAGATPRSMLTLCKHILEQQVLLSSQGNLPLSKLSGEALIRGIRIYAREVSERLVDSETALREMTSIKRVTFSSKSLHSDVFRSQQAQSVITKVGNWKKYGVSVVIGNLISGRRGFPTEVHAFSNSCVAFLAANLPLNDFIEKKVRRCPECHVVLLRDFDAGGEFQCQACLQGFSLPRSVTPEQERRQTLIKHAARELAKEIADPNEIKALSTAANLDFPDTTFQGKVGLIWLRVLQSLHESDEQDLVEFLETIDGVLDVEARNRLPTMTELYLNLSS
ncbi:P-loop ATPase, Sll1717 family [Archangium violaceum]|uniref:P-loop ATPase, Sll1717 family n=1 Tax=Archangium violaceum TaxID=83451 RepID=UPI001269916E|nr:hypothetical protein [Archangium violaceum]